MTRSPPNTGSLARLRVALRRLIGAHSPVSLRRLAVVGVLGLSLALGASIATVLVINARWAAKEEVYSAFHVAERHLASELTQASAGDDIMAQVRQVIAVANDQRHVQAWLVDRPGQAVSRPAVAGRRGERSGRTAPRWFAQLIAGPPRVTHFPVVRGSNVLATAYLATDMDDEIDEVWGDFRIIVPTILGSGALALGLSLAFALSILRRIDTCSVALNRIRSGDLDERVPLQDCLEFAVLRDGINELATHLAAQRVENRRLQRRLLSLSDSERKAIASDLHDGMGPCLFALRAALGAAEQSLAQLPPPARAAVGSELEAALRHARSLQALSRSIISSLRPMTASNMTVHDLLSEVVLNFREIAPCVRIDVDSARADGRQLSDVVSGSVFRFAQESVLNAIRHGGATRVRVSAWVTSQGAVEELGVQVQENGVGPVDPDAAPHMGQLGIRDRIEALAGSYHRPRRVGAVVVTEIAIPLVDQPTALANRSHERRHDAHFDRR